MEPLNDQDLSLRHLFLPFLRLGLTAFGGPAMVVYIRELAVHKKRWLVEDTFKQGITLCQSLPGATAMQMAAYVGLRAKGPAGALAAYIGFGLPAFVFMLLLSFLYVKAHDLSQVASMFSGLQVIVVAIIARAAYTFGSDIVRHWKDGFIAVMSALLFFLGISPFIVIPGAALIGALFFSHERSIDSTTSCGVDGTAVRHVLTLLLIPLAMLSGLYLIDTHLFNLAAMMLKIDLFAFGGGFASLPLMLHEIVDVRGLMDHKTLMDGIALGQVTPGPIVITATFAGYLLHGFAGAIVATAAIFTPSFFMLIVFTPLFDRLKNSKYFLSASRGILSSFVGLLCFAAVKFGGAIAWDLTRVSLATGAFVALIMKVDILPVVIIGAAVSVWLL